MPDQTVTDREDLRQLLNKPYNRGTWLDIVHEILPNVSILRTPHPVPVDTPGITSFHQLGNVRLADGKNLGLFEIEVDESVDVARNRVGLRNAVAGLIDQEQHHGVLGIFNSGGRGKRGRGKRGGKRGLTP